MSPGRTTELIARRKASVRTRSRIIVRWTSNSAYIGSGGFLIGVRTRAIVSCSGGVLARTHPNHPGDRRPAPPKPRPRSAILRVVCHRQRKEGVLYGIQATGKATGACGRSGRRRGDGSPRAKAGRRGSSRLTTKRRPRSRRLLRTRSRRRLCRLRRTRLTRSSTSRSCTSRAC